MPTPCSRFVDAIAPASATIACETSVSGSVWTIGSPSSDRAPRRGSNGMRCRAAAPRPRGERLAAAGAEELFARPDEIGHVLDDAEEAHVRLPRHLRGAHGDLLRRAVRSGDDDRLGARKKLPERDGHVPRPGRHVDHERVELTPVDVRQELLERPVQHWPAPHDRRVLVEEEADRHDLQVALHRRDDHLVHRHRTLADPEHRRNRVAVDVGVENAGLVAEPRERRGQIRRQRRLADASLAARHRDHARGCVDRDPGRALGDAAAQAWSVRAGFSSGDMTSKPRATDSTPSTGRESRSAPAPRSSPEADSRGRSTQWSRRRRPPSTRCRAPCRARRPNASSSGSMTPSSAFRTSSRETLTESRLPSFSIRNPTLPPSG